MVKNYDLVKSILDAGLGILCSNVEPQSWGSICNESFPNTPPNYVLLAVR